MTKSPFDFNNDFHQWNDGGKREKEIQFSDFVLWIIHSHEGDEFLKSMIKMRNSGRKEKKDG